MKALSIKQPWAWLIVSDSLPADIKKDIENRTWQTHFRGHFAIHASKAFDHDGLLWVRLHVPQIQLPQVEEFRRGGIVGEAEIVDCVKEHQSIWFNGPYGFVLKRAHELAFCPMRGQLGFFDI